MMLNDEKLLNDIKNSIKISKDFRFDDTGIRVKDLEDILGLIDRLQSKNDELKKRLHMIWAIGVDYDGCDGAESLKGLIDELVGITQMDNKEFMACYYGIEVE